MPTGTKSSLLGALALLGVSSAALMAACQQKSGPDTPARVVRYDGGSAIQVEPSALAGTEIALHPTIPATFEPEVVLSGRIELVADQIVSVTTQAGGTVARIHAGLGATVDAGDPLVSLRSRQVAEARANFNAAERHMKESEQEHKAIQAVDEETRDPDAWRDAVQAVATAKLELATADQALEMLGAKVSPPEPGKIDFPSRSFSGLGSLVLRAPIDGQIIERDVTLGELISPGKEVFVVANLEAVRVTTELPTRWLGLVRVGDPVQVVFDPLGLEGQGSIAFISPLPDDEKDTVVVHAEVDNTARDWRAGMEVRVRLRIEPASAALSVPRAAVNETADGPIVFVKVAEHTFVPRAVTTGIEDDTRIAILTGLREAEIVTTDSQGALLKLWKDLGRPKMTLE